MSGNADEWCHDWYSETYYGGGAMVNPTGPATGSHHVLRGGSWYEESSYSRTAYRNYGVATTANVFGIRLARS